MPKRAIASNTTDDDKLERTLFSLPASQMRQLKHYAIDHDMSMTAVVREALAQAGVIS